jgi:phosphoribosylanthranilate isomerase
VASGVEAAPGKKDSGKMKAFVAEIQRVERRD